MSYNLVKTNVKELREGMLLGENLCDSFGNVLLGDGIVLKQSYIVKIKALNISQVYIREKSPDIYALDNRKNYKDPYLIETRVEAKRFVYEAMEKLYFDGKLADKALVIVRNLIDELINNEEIIISLGKLRKLDDYTLEHSVNVCVLSLIIGINMEIDYDGLMDLGVGAILHDIGKMLIPKEILNKPGKLSAQEYEIIKKHTIYGYELLKQSNKISEVAAEVALSHHERVDGNGYPLGKKVNRISTYSRIVAICDVYDALTSDRSYKKKIESHKALEYICKMVHTQFDNEIVKVFLNCMGIYPVGSLVKLNTNEVGLVVDLNRMDSSKPIVRILLDENGKRVKEYFEVDTNRNPDIRIQNVFPKFDGNLNYTKFDDNHEIS
ncbi:MAG: HD-GYP domain-containing protein [Maledivibacter sp.]|jgi:putative nucleotidyltransferase with HDIG domain|nr:HD-GYP domain-containing protein [Maledivibacter sp.]